MRGTLEGHSGWVTSLATSLEKSVAGGSALEDIETDHFAAQTCFSLVVAIRVLLSGISPVTTKAMATPNEVYTAILISFLTAYDCASIASWDIIDKTSQVISSDGAYALSASWDKTLRLWELATGVTTRRFVGHTNDVLSVSFSADNRQIVSGSRDRTIKLWNTLGDCKFTITEKGHTEWVSCVRFSPNPQNPVIVSAGWDKLVKVRVRCPWRISGTGHRMLCNLLVFATSEPPGRETTQSPMH